MEIFSRCHISVRIIDVPILRCDTCGMRRATAQASAAAAQGGWSRAPARVVALLAVGTAGLSGLAMASAANAQPPPIQPPLINHIVVLYLENHTFDNLLGYWCNHNPGRCPDGGMPSSVTLSDNSVVTPGVTPDIVPSVTHTVVAQQAAIDRGRMDGWQNVPGCAAQTGYACIGGYTPAQVPNLATLARRFAISDRTFSMADSPSWGGSLHGFRGLPWIVCRLLACRGGSMAIRRRRAAGGPRPQVTAGISAPRSRSACTPARRRTTFPARTRGPASCPTSRLSRRAGMMPRSASTTGFHHCRRRLAGPGRVGGDERTGVAIHCAVQYLGRLRLLLRPGAARCQPGRKGAGTAHAPGHRQPYAKPSSGPRVRFTARGRLTPITST